MDAALDEIQGREADLNEHHSGVDVTHDDLTNEVAFAEEGEEETYEAKKLRYMRYMQYGVDEVSNIEQWLFWHFGPEQVMSAA